MSQDWMIQVLAQVRHCDAEVHVNDIPVARLLEHRSAAVSLPVDPCLVAGTNELRIVVNPGPTPAQALQPGAGRPVAPTAKARAVLVVVRLGSEPDAMARPLLEVNFDAAAQVPATAPHTLSVRGPLPVSPGRRAWQSTARIAALTPDVAASALQFVARVRDEIMRGAIRQLAPLFRARIVDAASSYGMDGEQRLAGFIDEWEALSRTPGFELAPVDPATASLRLCGSGGFVQCIGRDWRPLIRIADLSSGGVGLPLGLGRHQDRWVIAY